jgi:hypothetical protein
MIQNSLMETKKRYWTIKAKISHAEMEYYYNVEEPVLTYNGYFEFTDPDTNKLVWIGPGTPWIATEQKEKRRTYL